MKRSILKKMIVLTLAFAMVFSSVITAVSATEAELTAGFTATADKESYAAGDTVVVNFAVEGTVDAIGLTYGYDGALTLVKAEWADLGEFIINVDLEKGRAAIAFDGPATLSCNVFTMTFTVNADAEDGTYVVSATPVMKNGVDNVAAETATAEVVVGNAHECVFVGYEKDENGHWQKCDCGKTTDVVPHEYTWKTTVEATNKQAGEKVGTCVCGHTKTEKIRRVLRFSTRNLELANQIAVHFKLAAEYITTEGYSNPYVMYTVGTRELERLDYYLDDQNRPTFTVYINPLLMSADMKLYLYAEYEGELVAADVYEFKVIDYCYSQLNGTAATNKKLRTLLVDLLYYGEAAQKYSKYDTGNLPTALLTDAQAAWRTPISYSQSSYTDHKNNQYVVHENPNAVYKTLSLELGSAVIIKFGMEINCDLTNVKLYATNGKSEWEVPSSEFEYNATNGRYYVNFDLIASHQMDDEILFTFYNGDTTISNTYKYSVESYAYSNIEKATSSADLKLLIATMMNYGRSANAYVS